jgi:ATP-binding cassette, subfamily B, bacterial
MGNSAQGDRALYVRLVRDARRYWPHIGLIFVLDLLAVPLALLLPLPFAIVIDSVLGTVPVAGPLASISDGWSWTTLLVFACVLLVAVTGLSRLQALGSSLLTNWTGARLTLDFRARVFRHLQRLSFSYHDTAGTTDSVYRIQYDAPAISWVAVNGVTPFITAGATLVAMIYIVARIDPQLAFIALAVAPVLVILARVSRRTVRRRWRHVKRLEASSMSVVQEVLGNLRVVKGFGQEEREQQRFVAVSSSSLNERVKVSAVEGFMSFLSAVTTAVGTALVIFVGAVHVQSGQLTLGELTLVIGYMGQLYGPLRTLSDSVTTLQSSLTSAERAYAVLDQAPDVESRPGARRLVRARGDVRFEELTFGYEADRPVLADVTLDVPAGSRVGVQGMTGSGKTTLISLLMRFYDADKGRIVLDGVDIREYRIEDLRDQFAIVLQEPVLFSGSVADNIAYARPEATADEIVEAARDANAHDFITRMSEGYETLVGERGMTLSGGERQRISLARAFLKDAPILVLDEPTSAVDLQTESTIVEAMERLMDGRTSFMIAHRLSTLRTCDLRVEVRAGRVFTMDPESAGESRHAQLTRPRQLGLQVSHGSVRASEGST